MLDGVAVLPHRLPKCCFAGCVQQLTKGVLCLQQLCFPVWLSFCSTAFVWKTCSSKAKIRNFTNIALSVREDKTDLFIVLVLLNCKGQWVEREILEAKLYIYIIIS